MRTKFHRLFIMLALFAGVHPALAQIVTLSITRRGNQVVLFWPTTATNYVLQNTTNLLPATWNAVLPAAVVVNAQNPVTNPISGTHQFYRLMQIATPSGMALIPAGAFTMGDTLDGESDAIPISVTVSGVSDW